MAIKQITDLVKNTDSVQKYKNTHVFVTGKTFVLKSQLVALGGKFDTVFSKEKERDTAYNFVSKGYWIPLEKADEAQQLLVTAA